MTDTPATINPTTDEPKTPDQPSSLPGEKVSVVVGATTPEEPKPAEPDTITTSPTAPSLEPKVSATEAVAKSESEPEPVTPPAAAPFVVTESEVKDDISEHQKLAEEIEILTGEIQALEAKIERLAGAATASAEPVTTPVSSMPTMSSVPDLTPPSVPELNSVAPIPAAPSIPEVPLKIESDSSMSQEPKPAFAAPSTPPISEPTPTPAPSSVPFSVPAPVSPGIPSPSLSDTGSGSDKLRERSLEGIYPKKDFDVNHPTPAHTDSAKITEEHQSVLGMIGEIIGIIGVVLFVLMLLSPLYKEMLDPTLWDAVRTFGWLSAVIGLFIGFVLSMFQHGKWGMKIFLLIVLVLSGLLYYSINNPGSFLESALGSILSFYQ